MQSEVELDIELVYILFCLFKEKLGFTISW